LSILGRIFHTLCVWAGLSDASDAHITPSHGWLLAEPALAREQRREFDSARTTRLRERGGRA
jgi:hypothetical protein